MVDLNRPDIRIAVIELIDAVRKLKQTAIEPHGDSSKTIVDRHTYDHVARMVEELADVQRD